MDDGPGHRDDDRRATRPRQVGDAGDAPVAAIHAGVPEGQRRQGREDGDEIHEAWPVSRRIPGIELKPKGDVGGEPRHGQVAQRRRTSTC